METGSMPGEWWAADPPRIHAQLIKSRSTDRAAYNQLITLYSRRSLLPSALRLFLRLPFPPTPVSWTAVISAHSSDPSAALRLLSSAPRRLLNQGTVSSLLKTLPPSYSPLLHALALKLALHLLPFAGTALVRSYSLLRLPSASLAAFADVRCKDHVCYAALLAALSHNHLFAETLSLFSAMRRDDIAPSSSAFAVSAALRSASRLATLDHTRALHAHSAVVGILSDLVVATALVDAYGRSGRIDYARNVFDELPSHPNLVTYNAMLAAYAQQGDAEAAADLFDQMARPDELTFLAVLTACSNAGMAAEAERWFDSMSSRYGVEPGLEHYSCLVGSLARVGRLADAERVVTEMPLEPDASVWRTLLSGCVVRANIEVGRTAARMLLEIDPLDDSAYVMLANVYSATGMRDEKAGVWAEMKRLGVKKEGGRSWVELKGEVHVFASGDRKHKRAADVYAKLMELEEEVRRVGYDHTEAVEDEGVRYHSERLAAAFVLASGAAPEAKGLRVVKNLRICRDCHEFFKCLSRVREGEIVVRDFNRYHTFRQGACTCRDCW